MDAETLALCTGAQIDRARLFLEPVAATLHRFQITTVRQRAAFLATVAIESQNLAKTEESLYYKDPARLLKIYPRVFKTLADAAPYARNPDALGELLYQGYWGRGLIQLTGRKNYTLASDSLGYDYLHQPELVAQPMHAALTAGWYWDTTNCNAPAEAGDMRGVTLRVNGPALMHLAERTEQYLKNVAVLS